MSVVDLLGASPAGTNDVLLITAERTWTRGDLERAVDARAEVLRRVHAEGSVVPCAIEADAVGVIELLALWRIGATPAPLNRALTEPERATAVDTLRGARPGAQAILWTSGTAGRSRGVALSFAALQANAAASCERLSLSPADIWLASLSPAHVGGLVLIARALLIGCGLALSGRFEVATAWAALRGSSSVTHLSVVPTQLLRLIEAAGDAPPPPTLRCVLVGGAGIPAQLLTRALAARWPVALTYGLTEATSQVATSPPESTRRQPGSVGRPLHGVEVRIAPDGEILVRGATLASGYVGEGAGPLVDDEGWHHTGDVGHMDGDGDLWVIGRRVDRIVTGGVTVDAVEIEEALRSHPLVADACVVGVPDATWGERVAAWVEPAPADAPVDGGQLDVHLRSRLSAPKLPRHYHVAEGIPRNANGKVDRAKVGDVLRRNAGRLG
ncbi:MAG: class I adenylate-forming enzyme family protein [Gemmatimonadales bacterium]